MTQDQMYDDLRNWITAVTKSYYGLEEIQRLGKGMRAEKLSEANLYKTLPLTQ